MLFSFPGMAQLEIGRVSPIEVRLIGRALFDGGLFFSDKTPLGNGVEVNDLRLGVVARMPEHWSAKLEIGFAKNKVSAKDIYLDYSRGRHLIRVGHAFETFGLEYGTGTADMKFHTHATAVRVFGDRRKLGVSYIYNGDPFSVSAGLFSDGDVENNSDEDEGFALAGRFLFRPRMTESQTLHLGASFRFSEHGKAEAGTLTFSAGAPSDLISARFLHAEVTQVVNQWRLGGEFLWVADRLLMQGEFVAALVNRSGPAENYTGLGGYMQMGYSLLGGSYGYNSLAGMSRSPGMGSLELLLRYGYTDTNDKNAGVLGGKQNDLSVGAIYYISRYIAVKGSYSWVSVDRHARGGEEQFSMLQGRFQVNF